MRQNARWFSVLLISLAFAAGFCLRAGAQPAQLAGYAAAAAVILTLASSRRGPQRNAKLSREDQAFLRAFESTKLAPADFHHRDHIRAAWTALASYPVDEALGRYSAALRRLTARAGKPESYHETITWAYLLLIHERMKGQDGDRRFSDFAARNPDLLARHPSLLQTYYRPQELDSERARRFFILPGAAAAPTQAGVSPTRELISGSMKSEC